MKGKLKIEVIAQSGDKEEFEDRIEEFIKNKKVEDIKYSYTINEWQRPFYSAMIIYKEN